ETLFGAERARSATIDEQAHLLAENAAQQLFQAFDTTDIARIRDRARLHILVDRIVAQAAGEFAQHVTSASVAELHTALEHFTDIFSTAENTLSSFSLNDAAARAFGGEPGASLWSGDVRTAIAATIVLESVGGPAASLVHEIAKCFASKPHDRYMKRELIADLRSTIFPHFREHMLAFAATVATRVSVIYTQLANAFISAAVQTRAERVGSIDRALAVRKDHTIDVENQLRERRARIEAELSSIYRAVDAFLT